jgi:SAM-dependent methyltransferase
MDDKLRDLDVIQEISPDDVMYKSNPDHYFLWGPQALETISGFRGLSALSPIKTILDLPSGHGRVLRSLRAAFPDAEIAACDVDRDAVDFCARTFDAQPIYSTVDLGAVPLPDTYDLIWCGSLLTHVHADQWRALLGLFSKHLSNSGLLVFTTHGRLQADNLRSKRNTLGLPDWAASTILSDYDHFGFGYQNYSGKQGYGISLSSPSWVCSQVMGTSGLRLLGYRELGWNRHHDAVACLSDRRD